MAEKTIASEVFVAKHREALRVATMLTTWFRRDHQPKAVDVKATKVISLLSKEGIRCVLMGTHEVNVYRDQSRATGSVEVMVRQREFVRAQGILSCTYAKLKLEQTPCDIRFIDRVNGKPALSLTKAVLPWQRAVYKNVHAIDCTYFVPTLEMALADKFVSMVAPDQELCGRYQDGGDFANALKFNRQAVDLPKLRGLIELANPADGKWLSRVVKDLDADQLRAMTDRITLALKKRAS